MPKWEGVETVLFYMDWVEGNLLCYISGQIRPNLGLRVIGDRIYADLSVESEPHSGGAK